MEYRLARIGLGNKIHVVEKIEREDGDSSFVLICGCSDSNSSWAGNRNTLFNMDRLNSCRNKLCKASKNIVENLNL